MKKFRFVLILGVVALLAASCDTYRHSMREPNNRVEFVASDFELSDQVTGEATVTRIIGIDWERTFGTSKIGSTSKKAVLPIIGQLIYGEEAYAIYDMLEKHPGYDVIFYPQVEVHKHAPVLGTDLYSTTTYKVTARLGKLKKK